MNPIYILRLTYSKQKHISQPSPHPPQSLWRKGSQTCVNVPVSVVSGSLLSQKGKEAASTCSLHRNRSFPRHFLKRSSLSTAMKTISFAPSAHKGHRNKSLHQSSGYGSVLHVTWNMKLSLCQYRNTCVVINTSFSFCFFLLSDWVV